MDLFKGTCEVFGKTEVRYIYAETWEEAIKTFDYCDETAFSGLSKLEVIPEFSNNIIVQDETLWKKKQ